jgi:hypothetical protein
MAVSGNIGYLFPAGGPVPRELIIGRNGEIDEIHRRIDERIHTLLTGERRIGKTTVCNAVCAKLEDEGSIVVRVEVPESSDAGALLQLVVDRSRQHGLLAQGSRLFKTAEPLVEGYLKEIGIPLDLSQLNRTSPPPETMRKILSLPLKLAVGKDRAVVLYFDELQRVVDYGGGRELLSQLVDIYSGRTDVVCLVDGSDRRAFEGMMGPPVSLGKLVDSFPLAEKISARRWREGLPARFAEAGLEIANECLDELIEFGAGRPYTTMVLARYTAFNARKIGTEKVGTFELREGIAEAERHLAEDSND